MDAFDYAFERTVGLEGEYSDVAGDRGGRTKYGITEKTFQHALERMIISGVTDIKDLTLAQAKAIYRTDFWNTLKLNQIKDIVIAAEIFDSAVNMGTGMAVVLAQTALDYLGETLSIDGVIGPVTIGLLNKWCSRDPRALMACLNGFQFIVYCDLVDGSLIDRIQERVKGDPGQQQFARGWMKRIQEYQTPSQA